MDAKRRGVAVQVILDKSQRTKFYTSVTFVANEGVPTFINPVQPEVTGARHHALDDALKEDLHDTLTGIRLP